MILKTSRIKSSSGPHALTKHLWHGKGNDEIITVQGSKAALAAMMDDARAAGKTYGIRHLVISPEQATSREQALEILRLHGSEFGYAVEDCTLIEHRKPRQDGGGYEVHWHAAIPEMGPDGGVLDSKFMFKRNEMVSRLAEVRLGHSLTAGRHNVWAAAALEQRGFADEAAAVRMGVGMKAFGPAAQPAPRESYSSDTHQVLKRNGLKTPALKATIAAAWKARDEENSLSFIDRLHHLGIDLVPGRRAGAWVAVAGGVEVTALHRLLKIKASEVRDGMARAQKKQAPTWARASGGYDALPPQDRARAEQAFEVFRADYEKARGYAYPRAISDYVSYVQQRETARNPVLAAPATPKTQAAPATPKALPLPDDAQALRRTIGESPFPAASRDPRRLADASMAQVESQRAKAVERIERAEQTIERTKPTDTISDGSALLRGVNVLAKAAIGLANLLLRPLGLPIPQPSWGAPRITGQHPGDPRAHEMAHRELEKLRDFTDRLPTPDVIMQKAEEVAASRQEAHDAWADKTAPARLKLAEIEARERAERAEQERRAKIEEARLAAAAAREERVIAPEFEGPEMPLDDMEFAQAMEAGGEIDRLTF